MKFLFLNSILFSVLAFSGAVFAKPLVVATIPDLGSIVSEVGGDDTKVETICRGTQDPHYIEAKPSYMLITSKADLVVSVGLGLEVGWLPSILKGARNPNVAPGTKGYLEVGKLADPIEKPAGSVTRAEGDVHPEGNPHVTLDPIRAGLIAKKIAERLGEIDPEHSAAYAGRAEKFAARLKDKTEQWKKRLEATGIKKVITYHKTINYFFDRFKIENPIMLEPKPGVPPSASHIMNVINTVKAQNISLILVENYFDDKPARRIQDESKGIRMQSVAVAVQGETSLKTLDDVYENLVKAFEGK